MPRKSEHLEADPSLASSLADRFGAGAGNAEQLIQANRLAQSQGLTAATLSPRDDEATAELDRDKVEKQVGATVLDCAVRGDYIVVVAEDANGRAYKDYLNRDGSQVKESEDPERAALRAQHVAQGKVREAEEKAAQIIADAQEEVAKIQAKGAEAAQKDAKKGRAAAKSGDDSGPADDGGSAEG